MDVTFFCFCLVAFPSRFIERLFFRIRRRKNKGMPPEKIVFSVFSVLFRSLPAEIDRLDFKRAVISLLISLDPDDFADAFFGVPDIFTRPQKFPGIFTRDPGSSLHFNFFGLCRRAGQSQQDFFHFIKSAQFRAFKQAAAF